MKEVRTKKMDTKNEGENKKVGSIDMMTDDVVCTYVCLLRLFST
jgi:hypothetical protein